MKLRVAIIMVNGAPAQVEEFDLNRDAVDVLTSVNSQITGKIELTAVVECPIIVNNLHAGIVPRGSDRMQKL
jgi:hypothetical protein